MSPDRWKRIEEIYFAVVESNPELRSHVLDNACAGNPELRREIESLVAVNDGPGSPLTSAELQKRFQKIAAGTPCLAQGAAFGHYRIGPLIGSGGMGEVYRAADTKLGRSVALKVLAGQLAGDQQYMARFTREAQVLASLNHPNIAAIYGLEESGEVRALAMELVEGPTLADRLAVVLNCRIEACDIAAESLGDFIASVAPQLAHGRRVENRLESREQVRHEGHHRFGHQERGLY